jgi:hypothetical protein
MATYTHAAQTGQHSTEYGYKGFMAWFHTAEGWWLVIEGLGKTAKGAQQVQAWR